MRSFYEFETNYREGLELKLSESLREQAAKHGVGLLPDGSLHLPEKVVPAVLSGTILDMVMCALGDYHSWVSTDGHR